VPDSFAFFLANEWETHALNQPVYKNSKVSKKVGMHQIRLLFNTPKIKYETSKTYSKTPRIDFRLRNRRGHEIFSSAPKIAM